MFHFHMKRVLLSVCAFIYEMKGRAESEKFIETWTQQSNLREIPKRFVCLTFEFWLVLSSSFVLMGNYQFTDSKFNYEIFQQASELHKCRVICHHPLVHFQTNLWHSPPRGISFCEDSPIINIIIRRESVFSYSWVRSRLIVSFLRVASSSFLRRYCISYYSPFRKVKYIKYILTRLYNNNKYMKMLLESDALYSRHIIDIKARTSRSTNSGDEILYNASLCTLL